MGTNRPIQQLVLALLLGIVAASAPAAAYIGANSAPRADSAYEFETAFALERPLTIETDRGALRNSIEYELPEDAAQGERDWYILDLLVEVTRERSIPRGARSTLTVFTSGYAAAQMQFKRDTVGGQPAVWWGTQELFTGGASGSFIGETATFRYKNYLQISGVRPGLNLLTLSLRAVDGGVVRLARLLPGSRIARGPAGPPSLKLEASVLPQQIEAGGIIELRYVVSSRGIPAQDVELWASVDSKSIAAIDRTKKSFGQVSLQRGTIRFRALAAGRYRLSVTAEGRTGEVDAKSLVVEVGSK